MSSLRADEIQSPPVHNDTLEYTFDFDTTFPFSLQHCESGELVALGAPDTLQNIAKCNPRNFSQARKNVQLAIACLNVAVTSFAASSYGPVVEGYADKFKINRLFSSMGILSFTMGFAFAPMFLAPFSELKGRRPTNIASGIAFGIGTLVCGVAPSFAWIVVARFVAGVGAGFFSNGSGTIADIHTTKHRNTPMAFFSGAAVTGIGLGSLVSGFIAQYISLNWVFQFQFTMIAICELIVVLGYTETRSNVLLLEKARLLNEWYAEQEKFGYYFFQAADMTRSTPAALRRIRWKPAVRTDETCHSLREAVKKSLISPFEILGKEPIVLAFSLWAAFSWSVLYVCLSAVPLLYQDHYGFSLAESNAMFAAECLGALIAVPMGVFQDKLGRAFWMINERPESRLIFVCLEAILLPFGLLIFGWAGEHSTHWIVPCIGICLGTIGITMVFLSVYNYLADSYGTRASSAIAAQTWMRNFLCGFFPLFNHRMFKTLGYGNVCTIFAAVGLALSTVPWVLSCCGPAIRRHSALARSGSGDSACDERLQVEMTKG